MFDLRSFAQQIFNAGVVAADPAHAVSCALEKRALPRVKGQHYIIAIGKAAVAMSRAALRFAPPGARVICVTNPENAAVLNDCVQIYSAAHPVPDAVGMRAGRAVMGVLAHAGKDDHVLFLISGGGSALLPVPIAGVSLRDKITVNELLVTSGLDISKINLVRQQLSRAKGGGLARAAAPAQHRTLVISDVTGDDLRVIASGPTAAPIGTPVQAAQILHAAGLWPRVPVCVQRALSHRAPSAPWTKPSDITLVGSNRHSQHAAAQAARLWPVWQADTAVSGDVSDAAARIAGDILALDHRRPKVMIWGGETTVKVTGHGQGGRNQELALRLAQKSNQIKGQWAFLSGGTDGRDGPTDAAGALIDAGTSARIGGASDANLCAYLANNDSYTALAKAGDLLMTGATGTNVADLQIFVHAGE